MATITASMFTALDGVVDPAVGHWHFPYFNDEMGRAVDRTHDADVIALSGSVSVVRQLLAAGLLDELHLFVHPALAGSGLRLFQDKGPEQPLRLLSSQPFATGVVYLVYAPDPDPPGGAYEQARESLPQE